MTQHDKLSQVKEELSKEAELYYTIVNECNLLQKYMNEIGKYLFTTSRIQKDEPNYKDAILIENKDNIDLNDVNDLNKNKIVILSQNFKYNKLEPEWFGKSKYPLIKEYQDIINQILSENHRTF